MNIVFMGTPEFAVPCLQKLIDCGHEVTGVFTQPDKAVGRKQIITPPPVKVCAQKHNIPVFQPNTLKTNEAEELIKSLCPDVMVVVAYGKILPLNILNIPTHGCINGHASILPSYRGASPIQWCIVDGEKVTGITTMLMNEGLDTGDMLLKEEIEITDTMTGGELHDKMAEMCPVILLETLEQLTENERKVITLYYYEDLTLKEISHILEVSESRVSQLHTKALQKMRQKLGGNMEIFW